MNANNSVNDNLARRQPLEPREEIVMGQPCWREDISACPTPYLVYCLPGWCCDNLAVRLRDNLMRSFGQVVGRANKRKKKQTYVYVTASFVILS